MSVLTVGETLGLLDPAEPGPLRLGMPLTLRFAGAESNMAIALARLGVDVKWISRVGEDPIGALILEAIKREGVDTRYAVAQPGQTGVFVKWREDGRTSVLYHRRGAAACDLRPGDIPDEALDGVRVVHVTGITMAISQSAAELVLDLVGRAKRRGIVVVFDPNFRPALPDNPAAAAARTLPAARSACLKNCFTAPVFRPLSWCFVITRKMTTSCLLMPAVRLNLGKNQNQLTEENIQAIAAAYTARQNQDKFAYLASRAEIAENDYNLNIPRYVDTFEEEDEIDLMAVYTERQMLESPTD